MAVFGLVAAVVLSLPVYHSASGPVELEPDLVEIGFHTSSVDAFKTWTAEHPGMQVEHLFSGYYRLKQPPRTPTGRASVLASLRDSGAADRILAAYRTLTGQLLLADGRIRVEFHGGYTNDELLSFVKQAGGISLTPIRPQDHIYQVDAGDPEQTVAVAHRLHIASHVVWANPDFLYLKTQMDVPNDPLYQYQWHHDHIGSAGAWDLEKGSSTIVIAVLDSGADTSHPDLADKIVSPRDTLEQDDDPTPGEREAHGTAAAGLAAASGNNGLGVVGVCRDCNVMPIRMMSENGWGRYGADADAFYWATDKGAAILSNSWGAMGPAAIPRNLERALRHAAENGRSGKGAVVLFASGNESRENQPYELASHPYVLGVGATSSRDRKEGYSNFGNELDLVAPAGSVTVDVRGNGGYASGDYMYQFGGTSAACPVAAGVVGLILAANSEFSRGQVHQILQDTADKIGTDAYSGGRNKNYGHGRVNALRALQRARGEAVCQPTPEICANGQDDDCDGLIDGNDPGCAPTVVDIGTGCLQDFQCGESGMCLQDTWGFPGGYCTETCEQSCSSGNVCVPTAQGGSFCLDGCASGDECREGYDCLSLGLEGNASARGCVPSCTVTGCEDGETCNEATGACFHNGPIVAGGACAADTDCSNDGTCLTEQQTGISGGFCGQRCDPNAPCADSHACQDFGRFSMCVEGCSINSDCREGFSCWPSADAPGGGTCWLSCKTNEDCDGQTCNEHGLCGDRVPPALGDTGGGSDTGGAVGGSGGGGGDAGGAVGGGGSNPGSGGGSKPGEQPGAGGDASAGGGSGGNGGGRAGDLACVCDVTLSCDAGCACDVDCGAADGNAAGGDAATGGDSGGCGGCQATTASTWGLWAGLWWLGRLWRRRPAPTAR